jgi:Hydantoinase/oxoprolinase N-terminal region.
MIVFQHPRHAGSARLRCCIIRCHGVSVNYGGHSAKTSISEREAGELGVDTGDTFTDVIAHRDGARSVYKIASTPQALSAASIDGAIRRSRVRLCALSWVVPQAIIR